MAVRRAKSKVQSKQEKAILEITTEFCLALPEMQKAQPCYGLRLFVV